MNILIFRIERNLDLKVIQKIFLEIFRNEKFEILRIYPTDYDKKSITQGINF